MAIIQADSMLEMVKICFLVNLDKNLGKLAKNKPATKNDMWEKRQCAVCGGLAAGRHHSPELIASGEEKRGTY